MFLLIFLDHLSDVSVPVDPDRSVSLSFLDVPLVNHEQDDLDNIVLKLGIAEVDVSELESFLVNRVVQDLVVLRSFHVVIVTFLVLVAFLNSPPARIVVVVAEGFRLESLA